MKRFFEVKNVTTESADIYIYGVICTEKERDWWSGEVIEDENDIYLMDFKKTLDELENVGTLNLFVNSPGGDVFATSTIISMLRRMKEKGTRIEAYIDALAASAASFLIMVADNIHIYQNSMIMVHKPLTFGYGNANDLQKIIDELEQIENSTMLPMYMNKANEGVTEEEIKDLIANESWLGAEEIKKYFNVTLEEETKMVAACVNKEIFSRYKHVPKELVQVKTEESQKEIVKNQEENEAEKNNNVINVNKEAVIRNKLNLINASLFIKKNKKKEGI